MQDISAEGLFLFLVSAYIVQKKEFILLEKYKFFHRNGQGMTIIRIRQFTGKGKGALRKKSCTLGLMGNGAGR